MTAVAIQGAPGAFSHEAGRRIYGAAVRIVPCETFEELFAAVSAGRADRGVVPVENTLAGAVQRPMDLLLTGGLHAIAETRVPVRLCLAARPGVRLEHVRKAASHPVALDQCHRFFATHPWIARTTAYDTAGSIKNLMEGSADYDAGIGSELAADLYGAEVLVRGLEDDHRNHTRFLVLAREGAMPEAGALARPKTSIAFTLAHRPGALHHALGCVAVEAVDLSRLESRPIPGRPWEYRFYADLRGAPAAAQDRALTALRAACGEVHVIGRYEEEPAGE